MFLLNSLDNFAKMGKDIHGSNSPDPYAQVMDDNLFNDTTSISSAGSTALTPPINAAGWGEDLASRDFSIMTDDETYRQLMGRPSSTLPYGSYKAVSQGREPQDSYWFMVNERTAMLPFEGENTLTGEKSSETSTAYLESDGSITVTIVDKIKGEIRPPIRYLAVEGGWKPATDPELASVVSTLDLFIPKTTPLVLFSLGAWCSDLARRIIQSSAEAKSQHQSLGFFQDSGSLFGGTQRNESENSSYEGDPEKGVTTQDHEDDDCCIQHDMVCTAVSDRHWIPHPYCKIMVDLRPCCVRHDINLWCGTNLDPDSIFSQTAGKLQFASLLSLDLAGCIFGRFLTKLYDAPWYCFAPILGLPGAVASGIWVGNLFYLATYFAQLTLEPPLIHYNGEKDHCCLCGGYKQSKCCNRDYPASYCLNRNGDYRHLCSCHQCRIGCVYNSEGKRITTISDRPPGKACCNTDLKPSFTCPRWLKEFSFHEGQRLVQEGKMTYDPKTGRYTRWYE